MKNAETSLIPSVSSFFKSTYDFFDKNNEIKAVLPSILVLRFLASFLCGFAVFTEILCGFVVSRTPLRPPPTKSCFPRITYYSSGPCRKIQNSNRVDQQISENFLATSRNGSFEPKVIMSAMHRKKKKKNQF